MRRWPALLLVATVAAACGDDDGASDAGDPLTVAFLRAIGGAPSTEPEFLAELRRSGFREDDNLVVLARDPDEAYPTPDEAAAAIRGWQDEGVDLIVALSTSGARVAAEAAPDVEVLFLSNDPFSSGLVANGAAPEGQLTGATFRVPADRTLALAQRAVPGLDRIGLAYPPDDPAAISNRDAVQRAADVLGIALVTAEFADAAGAAAAVEQLAAEGVGALLLSTSPQATRALAETLDAAAAQRLPVIANTTLAERAVLSLSPDTEELGRQLGRQAVRLLLDADPSAVPVEDPNRFLLTLNAGVASSLGISLPEDLLREADRVVP